MGFTQSPDLESLNGSKGVWGFKVTKDLLSQSHECPQGRVFGAMHSAATNPKACPRGSQGQLAQDTMWSEI